MSASESQLMPTAEALSDSFLLNHPHRAALRLPEFPPQAVAELLQTQPLHVLAQLFDALPPGAVDAIIGHFNDELLSRLLAYMPVHLSAQLIARQNEERKNRLLNLLKQNSSHLSLEISELLSWPKESVGEFMNPVVHALPEGITVEQAISHLKRRKPLALDALYIVNQQRTPLFEVEPSQLLLADKHTEIASLARPLKAILNAMDPIDEVSELIENIGMHAIPVCNIQGALVGVISPGKIYKHSREELASDIQTMVGASKEERALSSSWFAVKKRLPWLQINLLTAFLAAAVVGAFENLIAQFTALAILLPVAAGQSGNAGAQALAVTMRGLTLREITTQHWLLVLVKEARTGLINGLAIAVTCALGVFIWSQSLGLALVIALAMIVSLVIACASGAIVPIALKKFGLDPAQSSSIVLTTVTDIAGFMSFLGIATLLSGMLV